MDIPLIIVVIATNIIVLLIIRELVMWYWKINRVVNSLEEMHELARLLFDKEITEKKITVINTTTNKPKEFTIKEYLNHPNKKQYKI